jgi:hypothetical protein
VESTGADDVGRVGVDDVGRVGVDDVGRNETVDIETGSRSLDDGRAVFEIDEAYGRELLVHSMRA